MATPMRRKKITITALCPGECSDDDIKEFVRDAVSSWGGQFDPEDPLFYSLEVNKIEVGNARLMKGGDDEES